MTNVTIALWNENRTGRSCIFVKTRRDETKMFGGLPICQMQPSCYTTPPLSRLLSLSHTCAGGCTQTHTHTHTQWTMPAACCYYKSILPVSFNKQQHTWLIFCLFSLHYTHRQCWLSICFHVKSPRRGFINNRGRDDIIRSDL